jgi:hypothetical protein
MNDLKRNLLNQVLFLVIMSFVFSFHLKAQVTIGCLSDPQGGALLDLKEKEIDITNPEAANSTKGLLFPKVNLKSSISLWPLFDQTEEPQKTTSKGMVVYNVNKNTTNLNVGLCVWTGEEWNSVIGGGPSAVADLTVDWDNISIDGNYSKGDMLNPYTNIITLPVEVLQKGSYNIVAYSAPDNGYYFEASGEFFKTGKFNLILNGVGKPQESTPVDRSEVPDAITIYINGMKMECPEQSKPLELTIEDAPANYYFNCDDVDMSNVQFKLGKASTDSYINIRLQASPESAGAKYRIETNTVDGIKFEGSGELVAGQQMVALRSNGGIPGMQGITYNFYLISNSTDPRVSSCSLEIPVLSRSIKVSIHGGNAGGQYDIGSIGKGVRTILQSSKLFGLQKVNNSFCSISEMIVNHSNAVPTEQDLNNADILILSYNTVPDESQSATIAKYIKNKNLVVIQCLEGAGNQLYIANNLFGKGVITPVTETGAGATWINLLPNSPLTNGEYVNIDGKKMGYDGGLNVAYNIANSTDVEIVGIREYDQKPAIIRHKTKPYVLFGDGCIFGGSTMPPSGNDGPLQVDTNGLPVVTASGGYASFGGAYNAHLFVNMMIWAIKYRLEVAP